MRVLCFNPYGGGSHAQFLEDFSSKSAHDLTVLSLPARHFKWRIRQAAVGLSQKAEELVARGASFDLLLCTSMLDAAQLRALLPPALRNLPLVVYFHENQVAYPQRKADVRDVHFPLINWTSALAADQVWFNSEHNRESFLRGMRRILKEMPDEPSFWTLPKIREKSLIQPLGIEPASRSKKSPGPLHIAWVGRWEHDKRPDVFFTALRLLKEAGIPFRLSCLGQTFREEPPAFVEARSVFKDEIEQFGFLPAREKYLAALGRCDLVVSTAAHEFFGVALLEAVSAGCIPVVPDRLVYPEIYPEDCRYTPATDGPVGEGLKQRLEQLSHLKAAAGTFDRLYESLGLSEVVARYDWKKRAPELDVALTKARGAP